MELAAQVGQRELCGEVKNLDTDGDVIFVQVDEDVL